MSLKRRCRWVCFRWIRDQQIAEGVVPGEDVYIILRLDGRVRRSGKVSLIIFKTFPLWFLSCLLRKMVCNGSNSVLFFQGMPDWAEISKELPPMDDVLSKLERWSAFLHIVSFTRDSVEGEEKLCVVCFVYTIPWDNTVCEKTRLCILNRKLILYFSVGD